MTHPGAFVPSQSLTARLVGTLERAGDALMRANEEALAVECYALALRVRYVTEPLRNTEREEA